MLTQLAVAALVLTLGAILQTVAGFGIGLVAVPLLLWLGFTLPESVALILGAGVVQSAVGVVKVRRSVCWRQVVSLGFIQWLFIPLGVLAMRFVLEGHQGLTKQVVGATLLVIVGAKLLLQLKPGRQVHRAWGWGASGTAGLLAGLVGMGGPPFVLFAQAHRWSKDRFRGFLWALFLLASPMLLLVLTLHAGQVVIWSFTTGLLLAPFVWLGTRLGFVMTTRWEARRVQRAATTLLLVIGISAIIGPLLA